MGPIQFHYEKTMKVLGEIVLRMRRCSQPIIGAIQGPAIGGGFNLSLACDVRIAGESLRMSTGSILIGLGGCEMGNSYFLPRLIGFSRAAEYFYTGRVIDAARADKLGVVSRVVPDDELESVIIGRKSCQKHRTKQGQAIEQI
jgi:enoyl-CoA hydratase/carnithine racemase